MPERIKIRVYLSQVETRTWASLGALSLFGLKIFGASLDKAFDSSFEYFFSDLKS